MADNGRITNDGFEKESPKTITPKLFAYVATFGFLFGYDTAITGCVASNSNFLREYFPHVYENLMSQSSDYYFNYKSFDDGRLNFYRSSMYLVAFLSSSIVAKFPGHIKAEDFSSIIVVGSFLSGGGVNYSSFIAGRILFGFSTGVLIMFVTTHLCELAPCRYRNRLIMWFQLAITIGILTANLIYFLVRNPNDKDNWRIGLAAYVSVPFVPFFIIFDLVLKRIDVTDDQVREEYEDVSSPRAQIPLSSFIFETKYRPQLFMVICIPTLQQLTGLYAFIMCAPILFKTIGLGEKDSQLYSIMMCSINCIVSIASFVSFDKFRRRALFIQGGTLMLICQIIITSIIGVQENLTAMPKWNAMLLVVAWCAYVAGFAWSWGPLGWLVPSEILPSEIRLAGHTISVSMKMISMFLVTQFFIPGLCKIAFWMHLIILCLVLFMTFFVYMFVPETKGIPIKNVCEVWKAHPYWKKYIEGDEH